MTKSQSPKIRKSFAALRKKGFFARMNFWCCQSCGWYAIEQLEKEGKIQEDRAVFYHLQDAESFRKPGLNLRLAWRNSSLGSSLEIVDELRKHGLVVIDPPNSSKRIEILCETFEARLATSST